MMVSFQANINAPFYESIQKLTLKSTAEHDKVNPIRDSYQRTVTCLKFTMRVQKSLNVSPLLLPENTSNRRAIIGI